MNEPQPCPYPWCSREENRPCRGSGHTVTHYGPVANVECGDDRVSTQVLAVPGHDTVTEVYVEVTAAGILPSGEHLASSVFLDVAEVDELVDALACARSVVAGPPS